MYFVQIPTRIVLYLPCTHIHSSNQRQAPHKQSNAIGCEGETSWSALRRREEKTRNTSNDVVRWRPIVPSSFAVDGYVAAGRQRHSYHRVGFCVCIIVQPPRTSQIFNRMICTECLNTVLYDPGVQMWSMLGEFL